jgi:hypothetical protein
VAAVVPSPTRASRAERGQPSTRACTPFLPRSTLILTTLSQVQAWRPMGMPRVGATLLKAAEETSSSEARNVVAYEVVFCDGGQMDLKCETRGKIGYHLGGGLLRAAAAATRFCRTRNCWIMSKDMSQERFWAEMMV